MSLNRTAISVISFKTSKYKLFDRHYSSLHYAIKAMRNLQIILLHSLGSMKAHIHSHTFIPADSIALIFILTPLIYKAKVMYLPWIHALFVVSCQRRVEVRVIFSWPDAVSLGADVFWLIAHKSYKTKLLALQTRC